MKDSNYKNYIEDCLEELLERAKEANLDARNNNTEFNQGRYLGYWEVLEYLFGQADVFEIKSDLKKTILNQLPLSFG